MYHEIEGQFSIKPLIFDEDELISGNDHYPYSEIEKLEITSAPIFSSYGILTLRTHGRDITIPFVRSKKSKLERALREYRKLQEKGEPRQDSYEELKKLKELLDLDIITQEEFDTKKKQLLDL